MCELGDTTLKFHTWIIVIKERVVLEIAGTNGVPNISWASFKRVIAGFRQLMISLIRVSVTAESRGILGRMVRTAVARFLYVCRQNRALRIFTPITSVDVWNVTSVRHSDAFALGWTFIAIMNLSSSTRGM